MKRTRKTRESLRSIRKFFWTQKTAAEPSPNIEGTKRSSHRAAPRMQCSISGRARSKSRLFPSKARKPSSQSTVRTNSAAKDA
jgi:hypothetical protein